MKLNIEMPKEISRVNLMQCEGCQLRFYTPAIVGDGGFYHKLSAIPWYYAQHKDEYDYAKKLISESDHVLSIGSGNGYFSKLIPTKKYVGLEINKEAAKQNPQILIEDIATHAKSNAEKYDVVCSFQVLEHIENPREFLQSAVKCLKKGGTLIMSVPSEDSYVGEIINGALNLPPHHQTRWTDGALAGIATLFNLEMKDIYHETLPPTQYKLYLRTIFMKSFYKLFWRKQRVVDTSIVFWLSLIKAEVLALFFKRGMSVKTAPYGHTVTAVYIKK
ncbi:MAG: class I SAM-dependent methyltransferase [Patescibacteria group bacterium]